MIPLKINKKRTERTGKRTGKRTGTSPVNTGSARNAQVYPARTHEALTIISIHTALTCAHVFTRAFRAFPLYMRDTPVRLPVRLPVRPCAFPIYTYYY